MATLPLTAKNLHLFERRVHAVHPGLARRWGRLEPAGMLMHLDFVLRMSIEEVVEKNRSNFLTRQIVRRIAFDTPVPWPKGRIKAPDNFTPAPSGTIEELRALVVAAMKRFIATAEREPERRTLHPFFGHLTLRYWEHLHGKHFNHHFEQFGV